MLIMPINCDKVCQVHRCKLVVAGPKIDAKANTGTDGSSPSSCRKVVIRVILTTVLFSVPKRPMLTLPSGENFGLFVTEMFSFQTIDTLIKINKTRGIMIAANKLANM